MAAIVTAPSGSAWSAPNSTADTETDASADKVALDSRCEKGTDACEGPFGGCFNLNSDFMNCGACGTVCDAWRVCDGQRCILDQNIGLVLSAEAGFGASPAGSTPEGLGIGLLLGAGLGVRLRPFTVTVRGFLHQSSVRGSDFEELGLQARLDIDLVTIRALNDARWSLGPLVGYRSRSLGDDVESGERLTTFDDVLDVGLRTELAIPLDAGLSLAPFVQTSLGTILGSATQTEPTDGPNVTVDQDRPTRFVWQLQVGISASFGIPVGRTRPFPTPRQRPEAFVLAVSDIVAPDVEPSVRETARYKAERPRLQTIATLAPPNCTEENRCLELMAKLESLLGVVGYSVRSWRTLGLSDPLAKAASLGAQGILQVNRTPFVKTVKPNRPLPRTIELFTSNADGEKLEPAEGLDAKTAETLRGQAKSLLAQKAEKATEAPGVLLDLALTDVSSGQVLWEYRAQAVLPGTSGTEQVLLFQGEPVEEDDYRFAPVDEQPTTPPKGPKPEQRDGVLEKLILQALTALRCSQDGDPSLPECEA